MQQRIVTFVGGACVPKFCLPNMRSTCQECGAGEGHMIDLFGRLVADIGVDRTAPADGCRLPSATTEGRAARNGAGPTPHTPGAGAMTPAPGPRSNPADMLGARGSLMAFTTATIVGGLSAEHVRAAIRTSLPSASENSGTVA